MNNRTPLFALGALVLIAIIWRIASPPAPTPPGPLGSMPGWHSGSRLGDMGPCGVNPAGNMWAGVWNQKTKEGKLRSAVWVMDFEKEKPRTCVLEDGSYSSSMAWADDNTIQVLVIDSMKPEEAEKSAIISVDAIKAEEKGSRELGIPVARILAWGKDEMLAELAGEKAGQVAVIDNNGNVRGKAVSAVADKNVRFGQVAAVSGDVFVFSESPNNSSEPVYYLGNAGTGEVKAMFSVTDLPGRVEQILLSDKAKDLVGVVVYDSKKYDTLIYDCVTSKVTGPINFPAAKVWDVKPLSYVTYEGGFRYAYNTSKPHKLFSYKPNDKKNQYWVSIVQDSRLYQRKDGSYVTVSQISDLIDIRLVKKDGAMGGDLLPRR